MSCWTFMKDLQLVREYNSFFPLRQSVICPIILTLIKVVFALSLNHIQRRYMVCHDLPKYWFSFYVTHTSFIFLYLQEGASDRLLNPSLFTVSRRKYLFHDVVQHSHA